MLRQKRFQPPFWTGKRLSLPKRPVLCHQFVD